MLGRKHLKQPISEKQRQSQKILGCFQGRGRKTENDTPGLDSLDWSLRTPPQVCSQFIFQGGWGNRTSTDPCQNVIFACVWRRLHWLDLLSDRLSTKRIFQELSDSSQKLFSSFAEELQRGAYPTFSFFRPCPIGTRKKWLPQMWTQGRLDMWHSEDQWFYFRVDSFFRLFRPFWPNECFAFIWIVAIFKFWRFWTLSTLFERVRKRSFWKISRVAFILMRRRPTGI